MAVPFALALLTTPSAGVKLLARPPVQAEASEALKLLISVEQPVIVQPFPVRLTLYLHNSGQRPLWLYRRARDQAPEGSSLRVALEPLTELQSQAISTPAEGRALESAGLPHPKLVKLKPGDDYEEKTSVQVLPALVGTKDEGKPVLGRYRLTVTYRAKFSNAADVGQNLEAALWQGQVTSNAFEIELQPAPPAARGSISGTVVGPDGRPLPDVAVSLSDDQERLVSQELTGSHGYFSFPHLPTGLYWVTALSLNSRADTSVFRHIQLTPADATSSLQIVMLAKEIYEAKSLLHKPVLFRVVDNAGEPLKQATLEVTWADGTVLENVKAQSAEDGIATLELIPGRNFVTLKHRGCPKLDERVDVAEGPGIDAFKLTLDCARK